MKVSCHGINAEVKYVELPREVEAVNINVALRVFAMETYEALGGNGQEISPEVNIEAYLGEHDGKPVLRGTIDGKEWSSFLIPEKVSR